MPVRNEAAYLREALASVNAQTMEDFELIVVDDHSEDATAEILAGAAESDSRIRVLDNPGRGLVSALNTGMNAARAAYIARFDGDDVMPPERLRLQADFLDRHPSAALVAGKVEHWGDASTAGYARYVDFINSLNTPRDYALRQFVESPLAHPSVMLRRRVLSRAPYRDGDFPEDYDLWLRLLAEGHEFYSVPGTVLQWRDHPRRTSRVDPRYDREKFFGHKAAFIARWLKRERHDSVIVWAGGRRSRRRLDALKEYAIAVSGYVDIHPGRIGQKIDGVVVMAPGALQARRGSFILVYVGSLGARDAIGSWLAGNGFIEGRDFLFAA
jgi:glycosyltransferase involved in cell wall biosynthesis